MLHFVCNLLIETTCFAGWEKKEISDIRWGINDYVQDNYHKDPVTIKMKIEKVDYVFQLLFKTWF